MKLQMNCDTVTDEPGIAVTFEGEAALSALARLIPAHTCECGGNDPYWEFTIWEFDPRDERPEDEKREEYPFISFAMSEDHAAAFAAHIASSLADADPDRYMRALDLQQTHQP